MKYVITKDELTNSTNSEVLKDMNAAGEIVISRNKNPGDQQLLKDMSRDLDIANIPFTTQEKEQINNWLTDANTSSFLDFLRNKFLTSGLFSSEKRVDEVINQLKAHYSQNLLLFPANITALTNTSNIMIPLEYILRLEAKKYIFIENDQLFVTCDISQQSLHDADKNYGVLGNIKSTALMTERGFVIQQVETDSPYIESVVMGTKITKDMLFKNVTEKLSAEEAQQRAFIGTLNASLAHINDFKKSSSAEVNKIKQQIVEWTHNYLQRQDNIAGILQADTAFQALYKKLDANQSRVVSKAINLFKTTDTATTKKIKHNVVEALVNQLSNLSDEEKIELRSDDKKIAAISKILAYDKIKLNQVMPVVANRAALKK